MPAFGLSDTVANRRAHYTKREVKGADAGVAFMRKLAHASPLDTTAIINSGVKNCDVTVQDVARAVAIYGPSIAALKGKTRKAQTPSDSQEVSQHMEQEQQGMAVDIMFFMGVAFLSAVLNPLGLTRSSIICREYPIARLSGQSLRRSSRLALNYSSARPSVGSVISKSYRSTASAA